jgi:hypothetical protein
MSELPQRHYNQAPQGHETTYRTPEQDSQSMPVHRADLPANRSVIKAVNGYRFYNMDRRLQSAFFLLRLWLS